MPAQNLDKHSLKILTMEPSGLVTNNSHQELMSDCDSVDVTGVAGNSMNSDKIETERGLRDVTLKEWITVVILCFVNLINYMDRFTLAGILADIQKHFDIGDDKGGLLQTAFVLSYMIFAPLFGYLGDRYSRRAIMAFGVFLWSLTTLLGSYMDNFVLFIIFRAFVGIGEASYSTIAPTIISDLFVKNVRSKMLALFYFAIPVGSGLGYIVGAETARIAGHWQWGLRVTPFLGAVAVILIIVFMQEPERGQAEGNTHIHTTSWFEDITDLCKNRSFIFSTAGFTCVAFVAGALAWWGPTFIHLGMKLQPGNEDVTLNEISLSFGIVTMLSGLLGVPLGSYASQLLKEKYPRVDAIICAIGLFVSAPLIVAGMFIVKINATYCLILIFFAELMLNLNWALVADILLYVVIPTRRSTGEAFQILISHALGDAGSPYLIGVISEALKIVLTSSINHNSLNNFTNSESSSVMSVAHNLNSDDEVKFKSLQYALFTTCFVEVIGGFFFLLTALYIVNDKLLVDRTIAEIEQSNGTGISSEPGDRSSTVTSITIS